MTNYNRRDVLKTGTGAALIAGGVLTGGIASAEGDESDDSQALPETEQPDGWISPYGNARSANHIADGPEFENGAFETAWAFGKARSDHPYETAGRDPTHIAVVDGTVYSGAAKMDDEDDIIEAEGMVALDAENGSVQWKNEKAFGAPAVTDETVYCASRGVLHALDRTDGTHKWRTVINNDSTLTNPLADDSPTVAYGAVFLYDWTTVYAIETDDGSLRWRLDSDEINSRGFWQAPAVGNDLVFVSTVVSNTEIRALDPRTGETVWKLSGDGIDSPDLAVNSTALAVAGQDSLTIYDLDTREERMSVPASPGDTLALGEEVLVQYRYEDLAGFDLETGSRLWEVENGGREPILVGDTVYFYSPETGRLTALDKYDGTKQWEFETGHEHHHPKAIAGTEQLYLLGRPELKAYRNTSALVDDGEDDCDCDEGDETDGDSESDSDGSDTTGDDESSTDADDSENTTGGDDSGAGDSSESDDTDTKSESDNTDTKPESNDTAETGSNVTDTDESTGDSSDSGTNSNGAEDDSEDAEETPGFGVIGGLAGTVGGAALATRRLLSSDDLADD